MKKKEIEIVFITDAHLVYENKFLGIDTFKAFESVIDEVESKYKNADFYIFGGDLIEDQKKESFDFFWSKLTTNSMIEKSLFTRGNHDIEKSFFDKLFTNQNTNLNCESWQLININTYSEGNIYGEVSDKQINLINEISKRYKNKNLMIYMHHNLFKTDSPWLDKYITRNHENLSIEISSLSNIKLVISGHIHQEACNTLSGTTFISCPSTSFHFVPGKEKYTLDKKNPGYTVFSLFSDGTFDCEHIRTQGFYGEPKKNAD